MGASKESLTLAGVTFLERIVTAASAAFDEVVVVSRSVEGGGVRTIVEPPHDDVAPLFGIEAALKDAAAHRDEKVWILAVDYPAITAELLTQLRDRFENSDAELLVPVADGNLHLLCAGYSTALLPKISDRLRRKQFVLRDLLDNSKALLIDERETDPRALRNVNTPAEYRALERDYEQADASR